MLVVDEVVLIHHNTLRLLLPWLPRDTAKLISFILDSTVMPLHATESCLFINLAHLHDKRAQEWRTLSSHPQYSSSPLTCTSCPRQRCFARSQLVPTSTRHLHSASHRERLNVDTVERHRKLLSTGMSSFSTADLISSWPGSFMVAPR
jgi:hypothetical protein